LIVDLEQGMILHFQYSAHIDEQADIGPGLCENISTAFWPLGKIIGKGQLPGRTQLASGINITYFPFRCCDC
jgi:hypothetical protein